MAAPPVQRAQRWHNLLGFAASRAARLHAAQRAGAWTGGRGGCTAPFRHALSARALCGCAPVHAAVAPTYLANDDAPHVPVLLEEVLSFFAGRRLEMYVDGTLGAGGHASALLRAHPELQTLVGFDLDTTAHSIAATRLAAVGASVVRVGRPGDGNAHTALASEASPTAYIVHSNFGALRQVLGGDGLPCGSLTGKVDGLLLDLGISSMQVRPRSVPAPAAGSVLCCAVLCCAVLCCAD